MLPVTCASESKSCSGDSTFIVMWLKSCVVVLVFGGRLAGSLVRLAEADGLDEVLHVELAGGGDVPREGVEQFRVARLVLGEHVIDRVNDAAAEELRQVRLTIARAKNGFVRARSSTSPGRVGTARAASSRGSRAAEELGGHASWPTRAGSPSLRRPGPSVTPILVLSPPFLAFFGLSAFTFEKNAAMPQYSVCFQLVNGWLWHWAHWSWMPRKCWRDGVGQLVDRSGWRGSR